MAADRPHAGMHKHDRTLARMHAGTHAMRVCMHVHWQFKRRGLAVVVLDGQIWAMGGRSA